MIQTPNPRHWMLCWKSRSRVSWRNLCAPPARVVKTRKKERSSLVNPLSRNAASVWFSLCLLMVYAARVFPREGTKGPQSAQQNSAKPQAWPAVPEKPAEKHSTLEDRQRLVAIAHKLE